MQNILVLDTASFLPKERGKSDFIPNYVGSEPGLHLPCTITLPLFPVAHQICLFTAMQKLWTNSSKLLCVIFPPQDVLTHLFEMSHKGRLRERDKERKRKNGKEERERIFHPSAQLLLFKAAGTGPGREQELGCPSRWSSLVAGTQVHELPFQVHKQKWRQNK